MQKWEYLTFTAAYAGGDYPGNVKMVDNHEQPGWKDKNKAIGVLDFLTDLGEEGRELVTVVWRNMGTVMPADPFYILKRPKE